MKTILCFIAGASLLLTTGCWGILEIQTVHYVTAVGADYKNGEFVLYAQMLEFADAAKLEGQPKTKKPTVYVGNAAGKSLWDAANKLQTTAQQLLFWEQVSTIVVTENVLKADKLLEFLEFTNRDKEIRYNSWIFSTKENIEDIFKAQTFFKFSSLYTLLHEPKDQYRQSSSISPVRLYQFIRSLKDTARSSYLPSLTLKTDNWREDGNGMKLLEVDGANLFQTKRWNGWISRTDLTGWQWVNPKTQSYPVALLSDDDISAVMVFEKPRIHIRPQEKWDKAYFDITITLDASLVELREEMTENELMERYTKLLEGQILHAFQEGIRIHTDVLNLGDSLYRSNSRAWRRIADNHAFVLHNDAIRHLKVDIHFKDTGEYKFVPQKREDEDR
ncbi:Ger(x)C family spore germination protein [Paenibacillus chartarius]|uniref:Ger(X)C family spore germination protein n=1 Tax=Paenibacillus chartarius TaxID=747481 RepID=A0ABV6DP44_9BACL